MKNDLSQELRALADRIDAGEQQTFAFVTANGAGLKTSGFHGNFIPTHEMAIFLFCQGIQDMLRCKSELTKDEALAQVHEIYARRNQEEGKTQ